MHVATMARKRGMSCAELDLGWRYSLLEGMHVATMARKRGMSCAELDWGWEVFSVTRHACCNSG